MPHHLRYEDDDISNDERILHDMLAQLQAEYAKAAQPYIDRLARIRSLRTPTLIIDLPPDDEFQSDVQAAAGGLSQTPL